MKRILVYAAVIWALGGCAQTTRHRIATILFDGVPPLEEEEQSPEREAIPDPGKGEPDRQNELLVTPVMYKHLPYDSGSCGSCHDTSASNRMVKDGPALCLTCHTNTITAKKTVHIPAMASCLICHDPHKSEVESLLLQPLLQTCLQCHPKAGVEKVHGGVSDCRVCHNPHQSDNQALLEFR